MSNVSYIRAELREAIKRYTIISDCLGGEMAVKNRTTTYLPALNDGTDTVRYTAYLQRATFYNVTKRTLDGLCGQIFVREPVIDVPPEMDMVVEDADGSGVSLTQLSKQAVYLTLGYGRAGVFIDYPTADGVVSKAQVLSGDMRPTITLYVPEKVINWRTIKRGARVLLSLVVLEEDYLAETDEFADVKARRWRVLRLNDAGVYQVEIWQADNVGKYKPVSTTIPTDASGAVLTEIPFTFIGAQNNDYRVDDAPMYDIAAMNIAHFRNSADYEESAFMVGQPTPVFSGLTEDWVNNVLKGKVLLGSRCAISLPVGGAAELLQASPNILPFEAMQHKEKQMVALGARLAEQRNVVRTASEATIDHTTASSVLASTAKNVSAALTWAMQWAGRFMNPSMGEIKFSLNTDFDIATMSPDDRRQLIMEWQAGALAWEELRTNLRKSGVASLDDEEARALIDDELAQIAETAVSQAAAMADATAPAVDSKNNNPTGNTNGK